VVEVVAVDGGVEPLEHGEVPHARGEGVHQHGQARVLGPAVVYQGTSGS
jgi:hypothetical protein